LQLWGIGCNQGLLPSAIDRRAGTFDQAAAGQRSLTRVTLLGVKIACAASSFIRIA
jgi:hypothetical protein